METGSQKNRMFGAREPAKSDSLQLGADHLNGRLRAAGRLTMAEAVAVKWIGRYASPVEDGQASPASD